MSTRLSLACILLAAIICGAQHSAFGVEEKKADDLENQLSRIVESILGDEKKVRSSKLKLMQNIAKSELAKIESIQLVIDVCIDEERFEKILQITKECRVRYAKSAMIYDYEGLAEYSLGNLNRALTNYSKSLEIDPAYNKGTAWVRRAILHHRLGDISSALSDLDQANKYNTDATIAAYQASLLCESGKLDKAPDRAIEANRLNPEHVFARQVCGWVYACLGNDGKANDQFELAIKLNPSIQVKSTINDLKASAKYYRKKITK